MFPANRNRWVTFDCFGTLVPRLSAKGHERVLSEGGPARPFNDVESMLAELRLRGYKLGVLTNRNEAEFEAVHRTFRQPFDFFVTAERIRAHKPELWHFRAFQLLAQPRKDEWVHIASDWQRDIVPAELFGIQRVWLDRLGSGDDPSRATAHVRTPAEALSAVDWLFQDQAAFAS